MSGQNLEKWQPMSHPDLVARQPEKLFAPEFAERYCCLHEDIWQRISHLHGTIHTLEELEHFPFNVLYAPHEMQFWHLVFRNFLDTACIMLHGLVNDSGNDVHSILSFRNQIKRGPWCDQKMCDLFKKTLRERKFDKHIKSIASRVEVIRNNYIAHRLLDKQSGHLKQELRSVSLKELRQLFDATHKLFGALSFGSSYTTLVGDLIPSTVGG